MIKSSIAYYLNRLKKEKTVKENSWDIEISEIWCLRYWSRNAAAYTL